MKEVSVKADGRHGAFQLARKISGDHGILLHVLKCDLGYYVQSYLPSSTLVIHMASYKDGYLVPKNGTILSL